MAVDGNILTSGLESVRAQITGAIKQAADATGASFEYLLSAAKMESNMNPTAAASTSSARGLYQFIEQTWLGTVKEAGPALGYGDYADAISKSSSGSYSVADPAMRQKILKLRDDPTVSAAMAGVLTQSNSFKLTGELGRRPSDGELYIAHFMGVSGAARLIIAADEAPQTSAPKLFPGAAAANRPIFYDRDGSARSVGDVYALLTNRYEAAANSASTRDALASQGRSGVNPQLAKVAEASAAADHALFLSSFPQQGGAAPANAPVVNAPANTQAGGEPAVPQPTFRSLFQVGLRDEPVSSTVRTLWGAPSAGQGGSAGARPLDLFSDPSGTFSG
jgi:hypothetical protein